MVLAYHHHIRNSRLGWVDEVPWFNCLHCSGTNNGGQQAAYTHSATHKQAKQNSKHNTIICNSRLGWLIRLRRCHGLSGWTAPEPKRAAAPVLYMSHTPSREHSCGCRYIFLSSFNNRQQQAADNKQRTNNNQHGEKQQHHTFNRPPTTSKTTTDKVTILRCW